MKRILLVIFLGLFIASLVRTFIVEVYLVQGSSMEPTLQSGQKVIVVKVTSIDIDDIIVFRSIESSDMNLVKRVCGMPGDQIVFREKKRTLGPNEYFVMGDNREDSHDSRHFGPIREESIEGEVILK